MTKNGKIKTQVEHLLPKTHAPAHAAIGSGGRLPCLKPATGRACSK